MQQAVKSANYSIKKNAVTLTVITLLYLAVSSVLIGFKTEQIILALLVNVLYYASPGTRKFITGFSIFIVYWIVFDYMKAFPNYNFNTVHLESLYQSEKFLFGISNGDTIVTPNEFWLQHHQSFLDVMTGMFYLCWIPVPLLFATYLFFKNKEQFLRFALTFFLVNLLGFIIYYIYPAAPPWYIQQNGFHFIAHTNGNTAGLQRFDDFFHVHIFQSLYAKSSNVFAAMPSLHSSYPVIVLYFGLKNRLGKINFLFGIITLGIWFSAVYTSHHYVLDVMAGVLCAVTGILLFQQLLNSNNRLKLFFSAMLKKI
jgi:membrane-associated phospholipid phosphatase